jgi:hypothetical protein
MDQVYTYYWINHYLMRIVINWNRSFFFLFLKLSLTALYELPSQNRIAWRGVKNVDLSDKYKTGTKFAWWEVSSCTVNIQVFESNEFLGKTGVQTIFSIEYINEKSVANHSYFKTYRTVHRLFLISSNTKIWNWFTFKAE